MTHEFPQRLFETPSEWGSDTIFADHDTIEKIVDVLRENGGGWERCDVGHCREWVLCTAVDTFATYQLIHANHEIYSVVEVTPDEPGCYRFVAGHFRNLDDATSVITERTGKVRSVISGQLYNTKELDSVLYNWKVFYITSEINTDDGVLYYAHAIDDMGYEYSVAWETTEYWKMVLEWRYLKSIEEPTSEQAARLLELEDREVEFFDDPGSECNWESPASVIKI